LHPALPRLTPPAPYGLLRPRSCIKRKTAFARSSPYKPHSTPYRPCQGRVVACPSVDQGWIKATNFKNSNNKLDYAYLH